MKLRIDELLVQLGLSEDLTQARAFIGAGQVYVNDAVVDKAGTLVDSAMTIRVKEQKRFVSRGGLKLQGALEHFSFVDPAGLVCMDVGASSGGFTDCLLQRDAAKVYAVDVAYGQLDWKIRNDPRVVVKERFNARKITPQDVDEPIELVVIDASFISLTKLIPPLLPVCAESATLLALIKPQFELPRELVPKGGVISEPASHQQAIEKIEAFARHLSLKVQGVVQSPITGPKGNKEFIICLAR